MALDASGTDVSGIVEEILLGGLALNSLIVCTITVRQEPNLHLSPTSETSQTCLWSDVVWKLFNIQTLVVYGAAGGNWSA